MDTQNDPFEIEFAPEYEPSEDDLLVLYRVLWANQNGRYPSKKAAGLSLWFTDSRDFSKNVQALLDHQFLLHIDQYARRTPVVRGKTKMTRAQGWPSGVPGGGVNFKLCLSDKALEAMRNLTPEQEMQFRVWLTPPVWQWPNLKDL